LDICSNGAMYAEIIYDCVPSTCKFESLPAYVLLVNSH
jgi:hypothetical protein